MGKTGSQCHNIFEDYEIYEEFLKPVCENLQAVKGTINAYAVFSLKANSIWVGDTSCFCKNCFSLNFQKVSCCKGWRECLLTTLTKNERKDASEKNLTKLKSHQEWSLKIRNQHVLFPNLATMLQPFIVLYCIYLPSIIKI